MWRRRIMTKINRLVFKDATQVPSFKSGTSASPLNKNYAFILFFFFLLDPKISWLVKSCGRLYVMFVSLGLGEWGEHGCRCWFCHAAATPPWVIWCMINRGSRCHRNTSATGTRVITLPAWVQLKIFEPFLSPIILDGLSGRRRSSGS